MQELTALSPAEIARAEKRLLNPAPGSRIAAARAYGIDVTLLLEQLRLPPKDRVARMLEACELADAMRGRARL